MSVFSNMSRLETFWTLLLFFAYSKHHS